MVERGLLLSGKSVWNEMQGVRNEVLNSGCEKAVGGYL